MICSHGTLSISFSAMIGLLLTISNVRASSLSSCLDRLVVVSRVNRGYLPAHPVVMTSHIVQMTRQIPHISPLHQTAIAARMKASYSSLRLYRDLLRIVADLWYMALCKEAKVDVKHKSRSKSIKSAVKKFKGNLRESVILLISMYSRIQEVSFTKCESAITTYLDGISCHLERLATNPNLENLSQVFRAIRPVCFHDLLHEFENIDVSTIRKSWLSLPLRERLRCELFLMDISETSLERSNLICTCRWLSKQRFMQLSINQARGTITPRFRTVVFREMLTPDIGDSSLYSFIDIDLTPVKPVSPDSEIPGAMLRIYETDSAFQRSCDEVLRLAKLIYQGIRTSTAFTSKADPAATRKTLRAISQVRGENAKSEELKTASRDAARAYLVISLKELSQS